MFGASSKILKQTWKEYENKPFLLIIFFSIISIKNLDHFECMHVNLKSGNFAEKTYFVCSKLSKVLQISFHFKKAY